MISFSNRRSLIDVGFRGFVTVDRIRVDPNLLPKEPGIYLVIRPTRTAPRFLRRSPAHHWKGRNPSLSVNDLRNAWCPRSLVLYIGKAGTEGGKATLRSRLRAYVRSGAGHAAGHWGGRAIWQLGSSKDLQVAWRATTAEHARRLERHLIAAFGRQFGKRPFANRAT